MADSYVQYKKRSTTRLPQHVSPKTRSPLRTQENKDMTTPQQIGGPTAPVPKDPQPTSTESMSLPGVF